MSGGGAVPFTILTGFLGAGKTTALNRMLEHPGGRRVAVLVNELGRIPIDGRLIGARGGDLLELAGGCVCCVVDVKNDLWDGVADVIARSSPDQVVLETTGIAEPPALIAGLERRVAAPIELAGVVCVVDAEVAPAVLDRHEEARVQVACADRVLMTKLDRTAPAALAAAHRAIASLNAGADRASFPPGEDRALADFLLERRPRGAVTAAGPHHAHRHGQLSAACFADAAPLLPDLLLAQVEELRPRLVRVKGFVHLPGDARRGVLELAGAELSLRPGEPWRDGEPRATELVFIGDGIDDHAIARRLWSCRTA
ncbi:MAG TPA: GTP-binding protein [Kofleriaceae bacterium]|nr:GTP-binding protein [Kofleriaceae bacterium]